MRFWAFVMGAIMACGLAAAAAAQDMPARVSNGLAPTPPMGWNSWNTFGCNVDEALIKRTADIMAASGMKDAGYQYVVIDDCWQTSRDAHGDVVADPVRFPSGMKALAAYIHSKGLKFGLYSDAGDRTCQGRPGSRGHEYQDAAQYAAWDVDYLKYDWCYTGVRDARDAYTLMADALKATGRPIVFSMCEWGEAKPWLWAKDTGNLWRTTGDIYAAWEGTNRGSHGVLDILEMQNGLERFSGPGHWNDPDMLEVGHPGLTLEESKSHFSLWALLAAPLIAGNDLSKMTPEVRAILTNREVIAVDQDPMGIQGRRLSLEADREVWWRPLSGGRRAVILLNRSDKPQKISLALRQIGLKEDQPVKVRDLWAGKDLAPATGEFSASPAGHGVVMVVLSPA
jgi:alpha-galactosidase